MDGEHGKELILAIYPHARGFAYALFEGPDRPIDWGLKGARDDKNKRCLAKAAELIAWFKPDLMILEDAAGAGSRRAPRIRELIDALRDHARVIKLTVRRYCRKDIRMAFVPEGKATRYEIAMMIGARFPEFAAAIPPPRKIWMSENPKLAIFDAVSLIVAFFHAKTMKNGQIEGLPSKSR
jgi:hypothetical protein